MNLIREITMSKPTSPTLLGLAVIAALLLTGCSAGVPGLSPTVAPVATATVAPVALVTGDIVDAATAAELKEAAEGQRGYPLDDGTFVVVNKNEPLPEAVQSDADTKTAATVAPFKNVTAQPEGARSAVDQAQGYVAEHTGKRVIVAWLVHGYDSYAGNDDTDFWTVIGGPDITVHFYDRASAQAGIDAWLTGKEDAASYAVVFVG